MVSLTENASKKLEELLKAENKTGYGLRLLVQPGGCSGYSYGLDFAEKPEEEDAVFENGGFKVFVEKNAIPLVDGATIDFVEDLKGSGFHIANPNAKKSCGCGNSFDT